MTMMQLYKLWKNNVFKNLTIDDILKQCKYTHESFRQWCVRNNKDLPGITPGLVSEVRVSSFNCSYKQLVKMYVLDYSQVLRMCNNDNYSPRDSVDEAAVMADIGKMTQASIAHKYGISQGRVSQIKQKIKPKKRRHRAKLTDEEIADIKTLDRLTAMEKYTISASTYYKAVGDYL